MNIPITQCKWHKNDFKIFYNSCKKYLDINTIQFYFPILSLFFYYHNTKYANQTIDLKHRYKIKEILECNNYKYYNSNKLSKCKIHDNILNIDICSNCFVKCIHLIDPIHMMMDNYNIKNNSLPNNYSYNYNKKINDINNTSYIDVFFCFLMSELVSQKKSVHFPIFYGSINGVIDTYNIDITEEYPEFLNEKWFKKNIGKNFTIDMFIDDVDSVSSNDSFDIDDDFICKLKNFPVQYMFLEELDGTLEDFLDDENINYDILKSCLFQIIFTLTFLQKHFNFTHNDLHINNIMYKSTNISHLYYKYNNMYFKVPTYGYIFKIIDFGRSIYTFKNKIYFNDVYSKYGEAEGQYHYPIPNVALYKEDRYKLDIEPNNSFDMCRLSTTMLDFLDESEDLYKFLNKIVIDKNGKNIYDDMSDSFDLYIDIAKYSCNGIPRILLVNDIFKEYKTKKRYFPKRDFYGMD